MSYRPKKKRIPLSLMTFDALAISLLLSLCIFKSFPATLLLMVVVSVLSVNLSVGMYDTKIRQNIRGVIRRSIISVSLSSLMLGVIFQLLPTPVSNYILGEQYADAAYEQVLGAAVFVIIFQSLTQSLLRYLFVHKSVISRRSVLFIGTGERALFVAERFRRNVDRKNFKFLGFFSFKEESERSNFNAKLSKEEKVSTFINFQYFCNEIKKADPDIVILANDVGEKLPEEMLLHMKMSGVEVVELEDFVESELGQIAVEKMDPKWMLTSDGFNFSRQGFGVFNYLFNAFLAVFVLSLTWPLMIIAAIAIYFEDGKRDKAPLLYKQIRVGINGNPFEIVKFRSMGKHAEKDGAQWASKNDVRVTKVGYYLRKYRIDELPQLINVFRGEMCFVGPRPERPEFVEELSKNIPYFEFRHYVKPGLTGWAQIKYPYGASEKDSFEKLKFDLYYIKHKSFLLDILVLLRTVETVLFGQGR